MKKAIILVSVLFLLFGCAYEEKEQKEEKTETSSVYRFVDVKGNSYEAELLEEVPESEYDASRLITKGRYQYYTDDEGNITSKIGVDVSRYQEEVNWEKVKKSGIDFAMIRLGYRGYGKDGHLVEDEYYKRNIEGAIAAGLEVGVYFFSQALSEKEAVEEAEFVLKRVRDYNLTYPVVFDTEEILEESARTKNLEREQYTKNCIAFCDAIREKGHEVMIYANMKWMAFTLDLRALTEYDFWYADYEKNPQCPYAFKMWQYTEKGKVPGIDGGVDLNIYFR
ncbi:MAG: glycoside hydrolase family 25 protein [Lachnospiraceae bacterium]